MAAVTLMLTALFVSSGYAAVPTPKTVVIPLYHNQGVVTSYMNVPFTAFTSPNGGLGALLNAGACWLNNGTILMYIQAPVMLPHGAVIKEIAVNYYYYYAGDDRFVQLLRMNKTGIVTTMAQVNCGDQYNGFSTITAISNSTVDNENYTYYLHAYGFRCDRKHTVRWVRIKYEIH